MSEPKPTAPTAPTILLVDDHPAFRNGVRQFLDFSQQYRVIGECSDGDTCLERLRTLRPDWAILDLAMPGRDGFSVLEAARSEGLGTRVVIYSMHANGGYADRAQKLGAAGFIAKEDALTELESALATPPNGFFRSRAVGRPAASLIQTPDDEALTLLTQAERKVIELLGSGLTSKEIARKLSISPRTVQAHRRNVAEKLDLHGPNRLLEFAVRNCADRGRFGNA